MTCMLRGTMLGTPRTIGGCGTSNTAACLAPLQTTYALNVTTTGKCVATPTTLTYTNSTSELPAMHYAFTPTTDGYYDITYDDVEGGTSYPVTIDDAGMWVLTDDTPARRIDIRYNSLGSSEYMQVRVRGNYSYTLVQNLVPTFQASESETTATFTLASRLGMLGDQQVLIPALLSEDVITQSPTIPPPYAVTDWSVVGVSSGQVVSYPLTPICTDNNAPGPLTSTTNWYDWIWIGVVVLLIIIVIVLAVVLRRKNEVHDPRLVAAVLASR